METRMSDTIELKGGLGFFYFYFFTVVCPPALTGPCN